MRFVLAAALTGLLALASAGAAVAQQVADDGMDCVYKAVAADYDLVAEVFLFDDMPQEDITAATQAIEAAKKTCATQYKLTEGQLMTIGELGVYASSIDYLGEELLFAGASEDAVNGVLDAYDTFTDDDVEKFYDTGWRSDAAFFAKMKAKVVGVGIPDEDEAVDLALAIFEIAVMVEEAQYLFMLGDWEETPATP